MIEEEIHGDAVGALAGKRTVVLSSLQALRCYSGETITYEIQPFGQEVSDEFTEGGHQEVSQDIQQISSRSSCRFLHVRDLVTSHSKDGFLDVAKIKSKLIIGEGSKDTTERPAPDCFSDLASSEVRCGENQRLNSDNNLHMHKDEDRSNMPFRDIGRETLEHKSYLAGYGSSSSPLLEDDSLNKDSYCSGMLLSSSVLSSYKYQNTHFRGALVEFVKELLKPTWHEGLLMRDAYKMIVKKAVDKIINSLTPDQIPKMAESIKQYLSVSKPKVAKLIEGYLEKYGKS
ncbi:hypothetical protein K7X08_016627 [Anisodus acutangulus]|uniref:SFR19-like C-terminal domain-containing protein n=1 Tax=Anisodus acutangulus TaxID=402998 RepID=A0A9Q1LGV3_9SOLA|nr:hypothetical protein K7X08_016627 [Anisodus acutangulus]